MTLTIVGRKRARALGLPLHGPTGPCNAITDVAGVEVGYATIIQGSGPLRVGEGPVRTGVTVVQPHGRIRELLPVWAGFHALNGNGEMTGMHWVHEGGYFVGPIALTNTHSLGIVHQGIARHLVAEHDNRLGAYSWALPVVGETCDAYLNDINGFHVTEVHVAAALASAHGAAIAEGNVGGGTGMTCYGFKGGTGTASRLVAEFTLGVLVQANMGLRPALTVLGVPVGLALRQDEEPRREQGSIIVLVATDAPLLPSQLRRIARRAGLGIARTGTPAADGSGDFILAFSTANRDAALRGAARWRLEAVPDQALDPFFAATIEAVEEAILNALLAAETMEGRDGHIVPAIDPQALLAVMARYGRA